MTTLEVRIALVFAQSLYTHIIGPTSMELYNLGIENIQAFIANIPSHVQIMLSRVFF